MSDKVNEHTLFKPVKSNAEAKADQTDQTARAITNAEAEQREAKTARLRQARLEREAKAAEEPSPAKPPRARSSS